MTAPSVACRCGHSKSDHEAEGLAPQCVHHGCTCLAYRASTAPDRLDDKARLQYDPLPRPAPVAARAPEPEIAARGERGPTIEQILQAGKRSASKRTAALAEKIEAQLIDLRGRLTDERQAAEERRKQEAEREAARVEVERLERELAAAKERMKARRHDLGLPGGERKSDGVNQCPDCPETFDTAQRLGVHRRWKHGYRKAG